MQLLAKLGITRKLIAITMLTTAVVIVLLAIVVVFNEAVKQKSSLYQKRTEQLTTVAEIIGSRSTAALVFDDPATARENINALSALHTDASLVFAAIYRQDGRLFAEYETVVNNPAVRERALAFGCNDGSQPDTDRWLPVCSAVMLDGERIGDVRLVFDMSADLEQLQINLIRYLILVSALVLLAFGIAFILSVRLQRLVSMPILALRETMETVSESKDYSVRAPRTSDDELGALVSGFNGMLTQIQLRDAELARYSNQLEAEVAARTAELADVNRRRILWLENLARFLRHELKNTTIGVTSSLDLIERRSQTDAIAKYVKRARTSVLFMQRLLDSVGNATTLEASFTKEPKTRLDLAELIHQCSDNYKALYRDTRLIVECEDNVEVNGNHTHLVQLLDKLVANAVDHSNQGTPITVALKKANGHAVLSVADEGEPLPEDKERMFELFVSMRHAERRGSDNLGLGLYIVKLIADSHGGKVKAEGLADRKGALFTVTLPLA